MDMREIRKRLATKLPGLFTSRSRPLAVLTLLVCLLFTGWGWYQAREQVWHEASNHFHVRVDDLLNAIQQRMTAYEQVLRGGVAYLYGSESVSRQEWRTYVNHLELEDSHPGILGAGFTAYLRPDEVGQFEQQVRASGFHDFQIWPKGERSIYTAILYLEPFDWRK